MEGKDGQTPGKSETRRHVPLVNFPGGDLNSKLNQVHLLSPALLQDVLGTQYCSQRSSTQRGSVHRDGTWSSRPKSCDLEVPTLQEQALDTPLGTSDPFQ